MKKITTIAATVGCTVTGVGMMFLASRINKKIKEGKIESIVKESQEEEVEEVEEKEEEKVEEEKVEEEKIDDSDIEA